MTAVAQNSGSRRHDQGLRGHAYVQEEPGHRVDRGDRRGNRGALGDLPSLLVERWLGLLQPVGGQLALLLRALWGESQGGQDPTTRHPAFGGRVKLPRRIIWWEKGSAGDKRGSPKDNPCGCSGIGIAIRQSCRSTCRPAIRG